MEPEKLAELLPWINSNITQALNAKSYKRFFLLLFTSFSSICHSMNSTHTSQ